MLPPIPSRLRLADVISRRPRATVLVGLALALAFALVVTPIVLAERWLVDGRVVAGEKAPVTVRVRAFDGYDDGSLAARGGSVVIARGQVATEEQAAIAAAAERTGPRGLGGFLAIAGVLFLLAAGVTHHLRRSTPGRLLRVQLVLLGIVAAGAALTKGLLLLWPVSVLAVPVALGAVVPTLVFDRTVGLAGGVLAAVVMSLLVPFDVGVTAVLVVQAVAAAIVINERARPSWVIALIAGVTATLGAVVTYAAFSYLSRGFLPTHELSAPLSSSWLASAVGGVMAGVLAMPLLALFQMATGEITQGKLVALEDLSHPLLRQIAEKAPGTWQHSLAMANMAEIAANSIGASGRLVRVGAYFHDLGKSLQATYFIENLQAGEPSPHDRLAPEVSCDAIFAHVTEGIALARRQKLPERIVDFMHMHHGDGVLEYFWAKCREQGNPRKLTVDDFRYPGVPPQSRETAILAICDAVEAASRTLKSPDDRSIEVLVQRIVYGKLHLGQLDESGLSMRDLRRINDSLKETIKHAHHGRIEYPWQREAAADAAAAARAPGESSPGTGPTVMARPGTNTQRLMHEPRLDSLDAPRPLQWEDTGRPRAAATPPAGMPAQDASMPAQDVGAAATMPLTPIPVAAMLAPAESAAIAAPVAPAPAPVAPAPAPVVAPAPLPPPEAPTAAVTLVGTAAGPGASMPALVGAPAGSGASIPALETPVANAPYVGGPVGGSPVAPPPAADAAAYPWERAPLPVEREPAMIVGDAAASDPQLPAASASTSDPEIVLLTPEMHTPHAETELMTAASPPPPPGPATGPMAAVPSPADSLTMAPIELSPTTTGPMPVPAAPSATQTLARLAEPDRKLGPVPTTLTGATGPLLRPPAAPASPMDLPPSGPAGERSSWASTLAARLDSMLDEADDDAFAAEPTKRTPPPPPAARRRVTTHEVELDDVEATIELNPHARPEPSGLIVGPPPATRPQRPATQGSDTGYDGDEGPTIVRRPAGGSMLPPRARNKPE